MNLIRLVTINLAVLFILISLLEGGSAIGRYIFGARVFVPKIFVALSEVDYESIDSPYHPCNRMKTDVLLDHVPDHDDKCFPRGGEVVDEYVVYSWNRENPIILILGGSTTSGFYQHISEGFTWPLLLSQRISKSYNVVNGGVGAYSSLQELYKFIRDAPRFKNIKFVISLNGINELPNYQGTNEERRLTYPFLTTIQYAMNSDQKWIAQEMLDHGLLPNFMSFIAWLSKNIQIADTVHRQNNEKLHKKRVKSDDLFDPVDAADRWLANVIRLKALSKAVEAEYFVFLQPTMGLHGSQSVAPKNSSDEKLLLSLRENKAEYLKHINLLYSELQSHCRELAYCIDISSTVPPKGDSYNNPRHHNKIGNREITEQIFNTIFASANHGM